jgi:hypothetical protein
MSLKLKPLNLPTEQVAVQLPHEMQRLKEGSSSCTLFARQRLDLSKSIISNLIVEYPKFGIVIRSNVSELQLISMIKSLIYKHMPQINFVEG